MKRVLVVSFYQNGMRCCDRFRILVAMLAHKPLERRVIVPSIDSPHLTTSGDFIVQTIKAPCAMPIKIGVDSDFEVCLRLIIGVEALGVAYGWFRRNDELVRRS